MNRKRMVWMALGIGIGAGLFLLFAIQRATIPTEPTQEAQSARIEAIFADAKATDEYELAVTLLDDIIAQHPTLSIAYAYRGRAYVQLDKLDLAQADAQTALELDPENAIAYFVLARILSETNNGQNTSRDAAAIIAHYTEAIRLNPNFADAYYNRGLMYDYYVDDDLALVDYTDVIRIQPDYALAHYRTGVIYDTRGESDLALAAYTEAIRYHPHNFRFYQYRGVIYQSQGDYALALADYNQALAIEAPNPWVNYQRGLVYDLLGETDLANADFAEMLIYVPEFGHLRLTWGNNHLEDAEYAEAIAEFSAAIRVLPDFADAYLARARVYVYQNQISDAETDLAMFIRLGGVLSDEDKLFFEDNGVALP